MSKYLTVSILLILLSYTALAGNNHTAWCWQQGNKYYKQKNYDSAAHYYAQIAKLEPRNAAVYYNLGNTYYRLNDVGNAVLNYEKALHIQPSYTQAADNLYLAQNRIGNRIQQMPEIFFVRWWKSMTQQGLANTYAITAILLFIAVLGYHIARRLGKISLHIPLQASVAVLAVIAVLVVLGIVSGGRMADSAMAVIMQEGTPMMAQPKFGQSVSLIPEGTTVELKGNSAGWYEVILPDGRTGWVQQATLSKI